MYIYIWTRYVQCIKPPGLGLGLGLCLRLILLSRLTSLGRGFLRVVIGGRRHIGLLCLLAARVPESGSTTEITHTHPTSNSPGINLRLAFTSNIGMNSVFQWKITGIYSNGIRTYGGCIEPSIWGYIIYVCAIKCIIEYSIYIYLKKNILIYFVICIYIYVCVI